MKIIHTDRHDEQSFKDALDMSPRLQELVKGDDAVPGFADLLQDSFQTLHQKNPLWTPPKQLTLHEFILRDIANTAEFKELHRVSVGDVVNAAIGTSVMGKEAQPRLSDDLVKRLVDEMDAYDDLEEAEKTLSMVDEMEQGGQTSNKLTHLKAEAKKLQAEAQQKIGNFGDPAQFEEEIGVVRRAVRAAAQQATAEILGGGAPTSMEAKLKLAANISRSSKLKKLLELAGRMRRIAIAKRKSAVPEFKQEVIGVKMGDDLQRVIPSELALLADPDTEILFLQKYVDKQLLCYDMKGEEKLGAGPIVICVDSTGSMAGGKELWSKAVCMGYMAIAEREKRDVHVCQFGARGDLISWEFPYGTDPRSIRREDTIKAVELFMNAGGTCFETPLGWAARQLSEPNGRYGKADIVILTDGEAGFSPEFMEWWTAEKKRLGFHSYGVVIGSPSYISGLAKAIDNVAYITDLRDDNAITDLLFRQSA